LIHLRPDVTAFLTLTDRF